MKGDTLVMKLQQPISAFEWTECQWQSPSADASNTNISCRSLHIECTKRVWHLARSVRGLKYAWVWGVNTYIYSFYVFNDVRVLACIPVWVDIHVFLCLWVCVHDGKLCRMSHQVLIIKKCLALIHSLTWLPIWSWPYSVCGWMMGTLCCDMKPRQKGM